MEVWRELPRQWAGQVPVVDGVEIIGLGVISDVKQDGRCG